MMIGLSDGIDRKRGIAWRVPDSLTLRQFLRIGLDERTPDHVTISRTRRLIGAEAHQQVFAWVWLAWGGLMNGKRSESIQPRWKKNAAMTSIRNEWPELRALEATDAAAPRRMDRKRPEWVNPQDGEAEITRFERLAYGASRSNNVVQFALREEHRQKPGHASFGRTRSCSKERAKAIKESLL